MAVRRRLGLALVACGLILLLVALAILFTWPDVAAHVAAIGVPAGVLGLLGVILMMAEVEYLAEDAPPPLGQPDQWAGNQSERQAEIK
jgi:uncharacterized membrane protein